MLRHQQQRRTRRGMRITIASAPMARRYSRVEQTIRLSRCWIQPIARAWSSRPALLAANSNGRSLCEWMLRKTQHERLCAQRSALRGFHLRGKLERSESLSPRGLFDAEQRNRVQGCSLARVRNAASYAGGPFARGKKARADLELPIQRQRWELRRFARPPRTIPPKAPP